MKKSLFTLAILLLFSAASFAQLTGVKSIPGNYPTIAAAIAALNTSGVGAGGVTFNVAAGHTETFTSPTSGRITTLTGSITNPVIFQKSGTGNNPNIIAGTGTGGFDAIIAIAGCDYVTFDRINLSENPANTNSNTQMEWGYAILKASATNGSQNITIKNCTVNLNKVNTASTGIYSNNHTVSANTQLTITSVAGTNSNLKIYSNTIANCYFGIYLAGYNHLSSPYTFYDQNNEIGKDGANFITNIGGGINVAYGIYTIYQNNLKVANNTVTSSSAPPDYATIYGIYMTTANNANFDLYSNTVSIVFRPVDQYGNAGFYPLYCDMGANGTTNVANIYNNAVTNCTFPTATGQAVSWLIYLRNMGVTANVYGNVVSNNTIGGATGALAAGEIRYFWIQQVSTVKGPLVVHDNSVTGNTRIQSTPGGGNTYLLSIAGSGTTLEAYNNIIDNNTIASNYTTNCLYVIYSDSEYKNVYNNTITNILEANGSTSGLINANGTLGRFYNNKIQNIKSSLTASGSVIVGLYCVESNSGNMYYYNNMISELSNPAAETSLGYDWNAMNGIYIDAGTSIKGFYNNTVYLNSNVTGTQANYGSSALCAYDLVGVDLRNNILVNTSRNEGPNGKTVAIRSRSTNFNEFTSNFNDIYAGTPGPLNLLFFNGSNSAQTLAAYIAFVPGQELQTVTEMPPFVNVQTEPFDIHLKNDVPTVCESGGTIVSVPVAITDDFDGDTRYPNPGYPVNPQFSPGAPDIGADEVGGLSTDLTSPIISFTPLSNTVNGLARTLTTTITDGNGVPTSGTGLPMLYWKINAGPYQSAQATFVSGNTYTFTFGAGAVLPDVVSYYIVAQDLASIPNVGSNPTAGASGFNANPPRCTTPPSSPYTYSIVSGISGIFHVGVGKTYTTLTAAVNDINSKHLKAQLTLILDDETYPNETFPINFLPNAGSSAANKLIIKPNTGITPVISGSVDGSSLIFFKGIDYLVIDGSNSGGTDKSLTFENISGIWNSHTFSITNNGNNDPSTNLTIKNCIILGNNTDILKDTYLIVFNNNGGLTGGGYDNITFENNWIKRAKHGLLISASAGNRNHNIQVLNNTFGSASPNDYITRWGIAISQTDNCLVSGNDIMGAASGSNAAAQFGVLYYGNSTNTKITKNKIHDWISNSMGSTGIKCDNDNNSTPTEISNNVIYNIGAWGLNPGVALSQAHGINIRQGGNIRIWNNSIHMSGPYLYGTNTYAPSSACIAFWNQSPTNSNTYDLKNNILRNSMTNDAPNPGPDAWGKAYGIMMTNHVSNLQFDNNDYYIDGYRGQVVQVFTQVDIFNYPTLASWQSYSGQDMNSATINPQFTSSTNLLPTSVPLNNLGVYLPAVPDDITGALRSNPPDMGAYEFGATPPVMHTISLPVGWSGISSYLKPNNPAMASVMNPIINQLILLYNFNGMYYPGGGINTLNTWDEYSGYAIKVNNSTTLAIGSTVINNKTVNLSQGWNMIPVLSSTPFSIVDLFTGIGGFVMAKEIAGAGVYWPGYSINSIGSVQPGKAYYVKMNTAGSINFSFQGDSPLPEKSANIQAIETPWNAVVNTPASHLIAFGSFNNILIYGDIIGGFTSEGLCAGVVEISNPSEPFALSLNGDDAFTSEKDGFETGNPLNYKLFRPSTGEIFELTVTYNPNMNTGFFEFNGISEVVSVKMSATGISDPFSNHLKIYPNPSTGTFTIEGINENLTVRIFNAFGREIYSNQQSLPATINLSAQAKGLYYARIETATGVYVEKLVIE